MPDAGADGLFPPQYRQPPKSLVFSTVPPLTQRVKLQLSKDGVQELMLDLGGRFPNKTVGIRQNQFKPFMDR